MPNGQAGEDPRTSDHAIIIGVTRYPELSRDGGTADLQGSINDAEGIRNWLVRPDGGGVPVANIEYLIREQATPADKADPTRDAVVRAFVRMYARCWPNGPAGPPKVPTGRRLYVYVSGHGLASDPDNGALLCSNSTDNLYSTVAPVPSIKAFRQAGFFRQFVVWFDGCMDWPGLEPEGINYNPRPGNDLNPPGPVFTAYAARPRLRAVESADAQGKMGGVFTRTLLAGLGGGAADPDKNGMIDGFSLQRYLLNTMPKHLPPEAAANALVDKQPFVRTDPGIEFGTAREVPLPTIVLNFDPRYNGTDAQVWGRKSGMPNLSLVTKEPIQNGEVRLQLLDGMYAVDVPGHNLQTTFEVTGGLVTKLPSN